MLFRSLYIGRIIKYMRSCLERNFVFFNVELIFILVPFKNHAQPFYPASLPVGTDLPMAPESFALERCDIRRKGSCRWALCQSNIERSESGREGSDPRRQVPESLVRLWSEEWVRPPRNGTNSNLAMGRGKNSRQPSAGGKIA